MAEHITGEQLKALREYADTVGKDWKRRLSGDWMRAGTIAVSVDTYSLLHQLRNSHGPEWLTGFDLDAAEYERIDMLESERNSVHIDIWGETSDPFGKEGWQEGGYRWAVEDWAPEYHETSAPDAPTATALHFGYGHPRVPDGWVIDGSYNITERDCVWCGDGTGDEGKRDDCDLCEGSGYLHETGSIVVFKEVDRDVIVGACASILWAMAWADHVEEVGCSNLSGCQIEHEMPEIGEVAFDWAEKIIAATERANDGVDICELFCRSLEATNERTTLYKPPMEGADPELWERFGDTLAHEYVGSGVSWEDDYVADHKVPSGESPIEVSEAAAEACCPDPYK